MDQFSKSLLDVLKLVDSTVTMLKPNQNKTKIYKKNLKKEKDKKKRH